MPCTVKSVQRVILAFPVLFKPAFQHGLAVHSRSEHQPNINSSNKNSSVCCSELHCAVQTCLIQLRHIWCFIFLLSLDDFLLAKGRQDWVPEETFHIRRKLKLYPPFRLNAIRI